MNAQGEQFFSSREFRIGVLAALAVIVLVGAAYFFGTGLRADTPASVAPSPIGSSLSVVPASRSEDYVGRLINSAATSRAASLAALAQSRSDFYADLNRSSASLAPSRDDDIGPLISESAAARLIALLGLAQNRAHFYADLNASSAAARAASLAAASRFGDRYDRMNSSAAAATSASLAELGGLFYAGLDKGLTDQGIRPSARSSSDTDESSAAAQLQWIKPEGIKPSAAAADPVTEQFQWIKPEGITSK
jgi:hypothetical protein